MYFKMTLLHYNIILAGSVCFDKLIWFVYNVRFASVVKLRLIFLTFKLTHKSTLTLHEHLNWVMLSLLVFRSIFEEFVK